MRALLAESSPAESGGMMPSPLKRWRPKTSEAAARSARPIDLVVAHGLHGAPVARTDEEYHEKNRAPGHKPDCPGRGEARQAFEPLRAVRQRLEIGYEDTDDFREAERRDGEIVVAKPENGSSGYEPEKCGDEAGDEKRREEGQCQVLQPGDDGREEEIHLLEIGRHGEKGADVGAHRHEAGVPQREESRESVEEVERQREDDVDGAEVEYPESVAVHRDARGEDYPRRRSSSGVGRRATGADQGGGSSCVDRIGETRNFVRGGRNDGGEVADSIHHATSCRGTHIVEGPVDADD